MVWNTRALKIGTFVSLVLISYVFISIIDVVPYLHSKDWSMTYLKHGLILILAAISILFINKGFDRNYIYITTFLVLIWAARGVYSNSVSVFDLYLILQWLVLYIVSRLILEPKVFKTVRLGSIIIVIFLIIVNIVVGEPLWLDYGVKRYTLGFSHPLKYSQVILALGILTLFLKNKKMINVKVAYIFICIFMIMLLASKTSNATITLALIIVFEKIAHRRVYFFTALPLVIVFSITYLLYADYSLYSIASGRFFVWFTGLSVNFVDNYDLGNILFGYADLAIRPYYVLTGIEGDEVSAFTLDNSFLEILIYHGFLSFVIIVSLCIYIYRFLKCQTENGFYIAIYVGFLFYSFFDSALFSIGNPVSLICMLIIFNKMNSRRGGNNNRY